MRTWMKLVIGILITVPLLAGCDSSSGGDESKDDDAKAKEFFIGEWHVTDAEGGFYVTFAEDGNLIMADYRGGPAHLKGTWAVDGETAVGPLKNPGLARRNSSRLRRATTRCCLSLSSTGARASISR